MKLFLLLVIATAVSPAVKTFPPTVEGFRIVCPKDNGGNLCHIYHDENAKVTDEQLIKAVSGTDWQYDGSCEYHFVRYLRDHEMCAGHYYSREEAPPTVEGVRGVRVVCPKEKQGNLCYIYGLDSLKVYKLAEKLLVEAEKTSWEWSFEPSCIFGFEKYLHKGEGCYGNWTKRSSDGVADESASNGLSFKKSRRIGKGKFYNSSQPVREDIEKRQIK
jgi:hypothetical protein